MLDTHTTLKLVASLSPDPDFDSTYDTVAFKRRGCEGRGGAEGAAGGEESLADDSSTPSLLLRTSDVIQFFPPSAPERRNLLSGIMLRNKIEFSEGGGRHTEQFNRVQVGA